MTLLFAWVNLLSGVRILNNNQLVATIKNCSDYQVFNIQATQGHNWHIHDKDIVDDQMGKMGTRCKSAAGHYNPYKVSLKVRLDDGGSSLL